jgi:hypothetical protein
MTLPFGAENRGKRLDHQDSGNASIEPTSLFFVPLCLRGETLSLQPGYGEQITMAECPQMGRFDR